MKKLLAVSLGVLASVCLVTGCTTKNNPVSSAANDVKQTGEKMMDETKKAVTDVTEKGASEADKMSQSAKNEVDKSKFIGEERAKSIALEKAGLSADNVTFDKVELDRDDGVWQYEVEFRKDRTEYDADIKAEDGSILSWDVDNDD